jgi:hypothetical protein
MWHVGVSDLPLRRQPDCRPAPGNVKILGPADTDILFVSRCRRPLVDRRDDAAGLEERGLPDMASVSRIVPQNYAVGQTSGSRGRWPGGYNNINNSMALGFQTAPQSKLTIYVMPDLDGRPATMPPSTRKPMDERNPSRISFRMLMTFLESDHLFNGRPK